MNARRFVVPAAALLLTSGVLGWQRQRISIVENRVSQLRNALKIPTLIGRISSSSNPKSPAPTPEFEDWKSISPMVEGPEQMDRNALLKIQKSIGDWSGDQLSTALDELNTMEGSSKVNQLRYILMPAFVRLDPHRALMQFADQIADPDSRITRDLANALEGWAAKDPAAATAWFDGQLASGVLIPKQLNGQSLARLDYETALVRVLLESDLPSARKRIAPLSSDDKELLLHNAGIGDVDARGYAQLVRENLSPEDAGRILTNRATYFLEQGYPAVTEYLSQIDATPLERQSAVKGVLWQKSFIFAEMDSIPRQQIEQLRQWTAVQSTDSRDRITGEAIAAFSKVPFAQAVEMITAYQAEGAGDDLIISFLRKSPINEANKAQALVLIEKINDPEIRQSLRDDFQ